jgi:hypothetical protein
MPYFSIILIRVYFFGSIGKVEFPKANLTLFQVPWNLKLKELIISAKLVFLRKQCSLQSVEW